MINQEVVALRKALDAVQDRLMAASVRDPGFAELHSIYWSMSEELIRVGNENIDTIRIHLTDTAAKISSEWESSKSTLGPWQGVLKGVVDSVSIILGGALKNPLTALLAEVS